MNILFTIYCNNKKVQYFQKLKKTIINYYLLLKNDTTNIFLIVSFMNGYFHLFIFILKKIINN